MDISFELEHIRKALDSIEEYDDNNDDLLNEIRSSMESIIDIFNELSKRKKEDVLKEDLIDILEEIEFEIRNLYDLL